MATPATTCPNCAEPLTAATNVCPRCGYHVSDAPNQQTAPPQGQMGIGDDASPIVIADQQTQSPPPTHDPSPAAQYPSSGPVVPAVPAVPAAMPTATPDQETARLPGVALTPSPQAISPTMGTVTQATLAPHAKRVRHRGCSQLALALIVMLAIVAGSAVGANYYLPNLPIVSRFLRAHQATATVVPAGTVLFQDPLTTKAHDWTDDQHCSFASDGYHVRDGYECYAPTSQQSDIALTVEAQQLSGPTDRRYGLGLRLNAAGDEYLFAIDSNGHWLFGKYIAGVFITIVQPTASAAIKQGLGSKNTLTVRAIGSHFAFAINKTPVGTAEDATLGTGYCGVEGSRGIEIVFTSLSILKAA
ncbi:MAG: hypothetical protein ACXWQZ_06020 [Ktedonobacterales bacterium]